MPDHPGGPLIRVRGLINRFGTETIHDGLDLDVFRGEVLGVVGGSGSGKSVLLRTIVGLNQPVNGKVEVFGRDVLAMSDRQRRERTHGDAPRPAQVPTLAADSARGGRARERDREAV